MRANLLGPFSITVGAKTVGPWARPPAKRLLELLFISPGRRTGRGEACEALFPHLGPAAAARELSKALSMARAALSALGTEAAGLIQADRAHIWADPGTPLEVDCGGPRGEVALSAQNRARHGARQPAGAGPGRRGHPARRRARCRVGRPPQGAAGMGPSGSSPGPGPRSRQGQGTVTARGGYRSLGRLPGARPHVRGGCVCADAGVRGAKKARPCGCHLRPLPICPGGTRPAHLSSVEGGLRGRHCCQRPSPMARRPLTPFRRLGTRKRGGW